MRWLWGVLAAAIVFGTSLGFAQQPPKRVALVIGNGNYRHAEWRLENPPRDASLIATRLRSLGFTVAVVIDADRAAMERAFHTFGATLKSSGSETVGFFYYAGHGAQSDGVNYLVPVDANARTSDQLKYASPPMQFLLDDMAAAGNRVNIIVLDACRNMALPDGYRAVGQGGLADIGSPPPNIFIAYAASPGRTAADGGGLNSPFTAALAAALETEADQPIELLFSDVQARVFQSTGAAQSPEYRNGLVRAPRWRISLDRSAVAAVTPTTSAAPSASTQTARRETAKTSDLSQFGSGVVAAAEKGDWATIFGVAQDMGSGRSGFQRNEDGARRLFSFICDRDYAQACNQLGVTFATSEGNLRDLPRAAQLYQKACDLNFAIGCTNLGFTYQLGNGVRQDIDKARILFTKACDANEGRGCANLGLLLSNNERLRGDKQTISDLHAKSCNLDDSLGCESAGWAQVLGNNGARNPAQAAIYFKKACTLGSKNGCGGLGTLYNTGDGVTEDPAMAFNLFSQACEGNDGWSCAYLGELYQTGRGVAQDSSRALQNVRKACDLNSNLGCSDLAYMFENGYGGPVDLAAAVQHYTRACDGGLATACNRLGAMYGNGRGVLENRAVAIQLYRKALQLAPNFEAARTNLRSLGEVP